MLHNAQHHVTFQRLRHHVLALRMCGNVLTELDRIAVIDRSHIFMVACLRMLKVHLRKTVCLMYDWACNTPQHVVVEKLDLSGVTVMKYYEIYVYFVSNIPGGRS